MAKVFVISMLVALSHASSSGIYAPIGTVGVATSPLLRTVATPLVKTVATPLVKAVATPVVQTVAQVPAGPAQIHRQVHEQTHLGQPIARTQQELVGHRTVQVGTKAIQTGHQYIHAGTTRQQAPAYSYQAGQPKTTSNTVQIAPPALPVVPTPNAAAIPPAPVNLGPRPADTVTQIRVPQKTRQHTRITPVQTRVDPVVQKIPVPYDVPIAVPRPVERIVENVRHVPRPYPVEVQQPYAVPQPYVVNPVKHVVEQPVINKHTVSVQQPVVREHVHSHTRTHAHKTHGVGVVGYSAAPAAAQVVATGPAQVVAAPALTGSLNYAVGNAPILAKAQY